VAKQVQSEADRLAAEELEKNPIAPKGHATPTRKDQEAQRKRPLVGAKTPEARALSKDQQRSQRERARVGMANGEEKYLPIRDRGPQKRFIRDFVDSRWSIGELVIPVLGIVVIATLILPSTQTVGTIALYGFIVLVVIDLVVMTVMLRRAMTAKFGMGKVDRVGLYAATRSIQLRPMRLPKPQVKRGGRPV
jgi:Protein of unknown function (DUF3043)